MLPTESYRRLIKELSPLRFAPPVHSVYNPLEYAWQPFAKYLSVYGSCEKEAVLLGMNPGPWGMAQTGIPFGEVSLVRDWMGIQEAVGQPAKPHPKRPIQGFDCARSEVSGARLWGWAKNRFGTPDKFFSRFLILNYCPLVFMEESGKNLTPDKLPKAERIPLEAACDQALREVVAALNPKIVVGVGGFARKRAELALGGMGLRFEELLHPSPANPQANKGWDKHADALLERL
jgi:single-strand selective monofunctional uracil DNA glycosylase